MPLLSLWHANPAVVNQFTTEQMVAMAGDGNLRDGSPCSDELREYLSQVSSDKLDAYAQECLSKSFNKSGMVLQDVVNELGRRLDYTVKNGRYQGTTSAIGFDGLWLSPEGNWIINEVKTTDAYRISLDVIAGYRTRLEVAGEIAGPCSILIVVGRDDTGELEAQVRGSRHAWDMRLISVEALLKLVKLKENADDPETGLKMRGVLTPIEYTRLDKLVDAMFTAATDVESGLVQPEADEEPLERIGDADAQTKGVWQFTDAKLLELKREQMIAAMSSRLDRPLIKKSRALYWSSDHSKRIGCTISKRYTKRSSYPYWYAYHPQWDEFLKEADEGYLILGCMDMELAFAIPWQKIHGMLDGLNTTTTDKSTYWHMHVVESDEGRYQLLLPRRNDMLPLSSFQISLTSAEQAAE